jgi:transcriptional regulator with XRE-family HTH domain
LSTPFSIFYLKNLEVTKMNCVERIKSICKERKIPISRLERACGFSNGYIGQLRKGTMPAERLEKVAEFLGVDARYLLTGEEIVYFPAESQSEEEADDLISLLKELRDRREMRMLFKLARGATKEEVEQAVKIIEALRK